jgi:hypothetical protein
MTTPTPLFAAGSEMVVLEEAWIMGLERLLTLCRRLVAVNGSESRLYDLFGLIVVIAAIFR